MKFLVLTVLVVSSLSAYGAIYKCKGPNGQTIYSQHRCGAGAVRIKMNAQGGKEAAESTNIKDRYESYKTSSRPGEIEREVKRLNADIEKYQRRMKQEMDDLREKKKQATNNFAGATWEQSISSEMSAVTSKYDALIDSAQARIDRLQKEMTRLDPSR